MSLITEIIKVLKSGLDSNSKIELIALRDENHLQLNVVSEDFKSKSKIERHKLIYSIIGDFFANEKIHALKMNLKTKDEIKRKNS